MRTLILFRAPIEREPASVKNLLCSSITRNTKLHVHTNIYVCRNVYVLCIFKSIRSWLSYDHLHNFSRSSCWLTIETLDWWQKNNFTVTSTNRTECPRLWDPLLSIKIIWHFFDFLKCNGAIDSASRIERREYRFSCAPDMYLRPIIEQNHIWLLIDWPCFTGSSASN